MKPSAFRVRVFGRVVSVQRRSRIKPLVIVFAVLLLGFCAKVDATVLPGLLASLHAQEWGNALGESFAVVLIPAMIVVGVLSLKSGQAFHYSPAWVQIARGSLWFRWKRESFAAGSVRNIRYVKLRRTKGGPVYGLRFEAGARTVTIFQHITPAQANEVLQACRAVGMLNVQDSAAL